MDPIIVDVRTEREFKTMKIKGAHNIPLKKIHEVEKIDGAYERPIYVYSDTGSQSEIAKNRLKTMGFDAHNIGSIHQHLEKQEKKSEQVGN